MDISNKYVDSDLLLKKVNKEIAQSSIICFDTEYDSYRFFREKLCLIQLKTDSVNYVIDPLARLDISILNPHFANKNISKVVHAGENDIKLLKRDYGINFANIFDIQVAAKLLQMKKLSLYSLIDNYLGIKNTKNIKVQRSNWHKRPLSKEQITYAVNDIEYLPALYKHLKILLTKDNLNSKAENAFNKLSDVAWKEKEFVPHSQFNRLVRKEKVNEQSKRKIMNMLRWRFNKAKRTNIAMFMIISDKHILKITKANFKTIKELEASKIIPKSVFNRHGSEIYSILKEKNK